jgi:hypothetical protein
MKLYCRFSVWRVVAKRPPSASRSFSLMARRGIVVNIKPVPPAEINLGILLIFF